MPDPVYQIADVKVGVRVITLSYILPPWMGAQADGPLPGGDAEVDPGGGEIACIPVAGMSDEAKLQTLLIFAMAVWRSEVIQNFPQNKEWGSAIYINAQGELKWTTPATSPNQTANIDYSQLPLRNGVNDYGSIIAIIHSHPRYNAGPSGPNHDYYDAADPNRLLRPSLPYTDYRGIQQAGDWATYQAVVAQAEYQREHFGGTGPRVDLSLVIVGAYEGSSGGDLAINQYWPSDTDYGSLGYPPGGASDGNPGARHPISINPLPPCSE